MKIQNKEAEIAFTNYWQIEHAARGLRYLSGNAGTWRLLVPSATESYLSEIRTGRSFTIESSIQNKECWDLAFEDGTESPFFLAVDRRQVDRAIQPGNADSRSGPRPESNWTFLARCALEWRTIPAAHPSRAPPDGCGS